MLFVGFDKKNNRSCGGCVQVKVYNNVRSLTIENFVLWNSISIIIRIQKLKLKSKKNLRKQIIRNIYTKIYPI